MKIIVDTHIWYYLGNGKIDPKDIDGLELIVTFNNIMELSKTHNIVDNYDYTRNAIIAIFKYKSQVIYEPPLIHLAKLANPDFGYDIIKNNKDIFEYTKLIAKGHKIEKDKAAEYLDYANKVEQDLQKSAEFFTDHAKENIKPNIKNKKAHRKEDPTPINRAFLNFCVSSVTDNKQDLSNIDWNNIEILEKTMRVFFNEIELGGMVIKANDWYDLFLLAYVQPGMKVWTTEKRWTNLINKAGLEDYLFNL